MRTPGPKSKSAAALFAAPGVDAIALSLALGAPVEDLGLSLSPPCGGDGAKRLSVMFYASAEDFVEFKMTCGVAPSEALAQWSSLALQMFEIWSQKNLEIILVDQAIVLRGGETGSELLSKEIGLRPSSWSASDSPSYPTNGNAALLQALAALAVATAPEVQRLAKRLQKISLAAPPARSRAAVESAFLEFGALTAQRPVTIASSDETDVPPTAEPVADERLKRAQDEIALLGDYVDLLQTEIAATDGKPRKPSPPSAPSVDPAAMLKLQQERDQLRKTGAAEAARLERQQEAMMRDLQAGHREREALRAAQKTIGRLTEEIAALLDQAIRKAAPAERPN